MTRAYDNAMRERAELMERIRVIDEFIALYDRFVDGTSPRRRLSSACVIGIVGDNEGISAPEIVAAANALGYDTHDAAVRQHLSKAMRSGAIRKIACGRYAIVDGDTKE